MGLNLGALLRLPQISTPAALPPAGSSQLYLKADRKLYLRHSDGSEVPVTADASSSTVATRVVEVNMGSTHTYSGSFVIADERAVPGMAVFATQAAVAATGRSADEAEMDPLYVRGGAGLGSVTFYVEALRGPVVGPYKISYILG